MAGLDDFLLGTMVLDVLYKSSNSSRIRIGLLMALMKCMKFSLRS